MAFHLPRPALAARRSSQRHENHNHNDGGNCTFASATANTTASVIATATASPSASAVKHPEDTQWVLFPCGKSPHDEDEPVNAPSLSLVSATDTPSGHGTNVDVLDAQLGDFGHVAAGEKSVLPRHDGLGTFGWHLRAREELQRHVWALEGMKRRRGRGRRTDGEVEGEGEKKEEEEEEKDKDDKRSRIEQWRVEQSRFLEAEIRRETRAMRESEADQDQDKDQDQDSSIQSSHDRSNKTRDHVQKSFWAPIVDTILGRLVGMDQEMLEIIMGEKLPDNVKRMPRLVETDASTWEQRLIKCVVYELGTIFTRMSHPFGQVDGMGIPFDESNDADSLESRKPKPADDSIFLPTLARHKMHSRDPSSSSFGPSIKTNHPDCVFTKHEWERQLDINLVFRYFRSRLVSETKTGSSEPLQGNGNDKRNDNRHGNYAEADTLADTLSNQTTSTASAPLRCGTAQSIASTCNYWDLAYDAVSLGSGSLISLGEV